MYSIIKIYSDELQTNQCKTFSFTAKSYRKVHGMLVYGKTEVSLVFDKNNRVFANSLEINTGTNSEPNKRALLFSFNLKDDFVKGNINKLETTGKVSIYLLME